MNADDPYSGSISIIISSGEKRLEIMSSMSNMFSSFINSVGQVIERINNLSMDVAQKAESLNYSNFSLNCFQWINGYIAAPEPLSNFVKEFTNTIVSPFSKFQLEYNESLNKIKIKSQEGKAELVVSTDQYQKVYQKYLDCCTLLEAERSPHKIEQLKVQCALNEKECVENCETLGFARRAYCLAMEKVIIEFEQLERLFQSHFRHYIQEFCSLIESMSSHYALIGEDGEKALQNFAQNRDLNRIESGILRRHTHMADISMQIPDLEFNIFDYLPWEVVFKDDIQSQAKRATEAYANPREPSISIEKDDIVICIEKHKEMLLVEHAKSGLRLEVPESILVDSKNPRYVSLIADDIHDNTFTIKAGQYVLVLDDTCSNSKCKTASGSILYLPSQNLNKVLP